MPHHPDCPASFFSAKPGACTCVFDVSEPQLAPSVEGDDWLSEGGSDWQDGYHAGIEACLAIVLKRHANDYTANDTMAQIRALEARREP